MKKNSAIASRNHGTPPSILGSLSRFCIAVPTFVPKDKMPMTLLTLVLLLAFVIIRYDASIHALVTMRIKLTMMSVTDLTTLKKLSNLYD